MKGMRRYAVIGRPIAHSLSPIIHEQFAEELGVPVSYGLLEPGPGGFEPTVRDFFAAGGAGVNVTVPFKLDAMKIADHSSHSVKIAQSANTLKVDSDGLISACNTDGAGFLTDLQKRHDVQLNNIKVLIFGAGGAVRGIIGPLINKQPGHITIANRSVEKAIKLVEHFAKMADTAGVELIGQSLTDKFTDDYDLVVNATSAGHEMKTIHIPDGVLKSGICAYDLGYGLIAKSFLEQAQGASASLAIDGLGMLVEQAALSFAYWEGQMPNTEPVLKRLRKLIA